MELLKRKQEDTSLEWQDIADFRTEYLGLSEHRDTCRKGSKLLYEYLNAGWINEPADDNKSFKSSSELHKLQKERYKIQSEKIELNRWLREEARDELIAEKIIDAVKSLTPFDNPPLLSYDCNNAKSYALCYGDCHYGVEFSIKGLFGEIINEYSPEIFERRMWDLYYKIVAIIEKEDISVLNIYDFGDSIDGLLRVSQLWKLRYGVVDSTIKYADFISKWLRCFTKIVNVRFQMVDDSNHSQLRLLGQPKNTFKDDNMSKFIKFVIKERLGENPNFEFIENPTGLIFDSLSDYNVLGLHGEVKNMDDALKNLSKIYKVDINYLIGAHIHHGKCEETAKDTEVINIPSIIGIDDYSLSLLKTSNSAARLFCFEEKQGKSIEYTIKLQN